jgi:hypothetical protein
MKVTTMLTSVYPVLLVLFSSISSTSYMPSGTTTGNEGCTINVQKTVRFGFKRKQVDGRAFPRDANIDETSILDEMTAGTMDVCVSANGTCQWQFDAKAPDKKDLSIDVAGLEDVVGTLLLPKGKNAPDIEGFLRIAKEKGAEIKELGNSTVSVFLKNPTNHRNTVTLVDHSSGNLLGSSVYRDDDGALLAKLVSMPRPGNALSLSIFVFEHKIGEHSGWVTEIICETGK